MKKVFILLLAVAVLSSCGGAGEEPKDDSPKFSLKTDKAEYQLGETIKVEFVADPEWDKNAWIGLIPSEIAHGTEAENDKHDIAYKYLQNKATGSMEFTAKKAGKFDLRMNESDAKENAKEIASVSFTIAEAPEQDFSGFSLKTDKTEYNVGETIKVEFVADPEWERSAWVGLIPSEIPHGTEAENDSHDIAYKYLENKASGTMEFVAKKAGEFDLRMNESDSKANAKEITSVSFVVK